MGRGILNARRVGIPEKRKGAGEWIALQRQRCMFELSQNGEASRVGVGGAVYRVGRRVTAGASAEVMSAGAMMVSSRLVE